jgi:hypothetical protein
VPTFGLSDIYDSAEQGAPIGLPDGNYDLEVTGARPRAESRLIFVDYRVLNGPSENKTLQTNLYIPDSPTANGAFYFRKKIKGFLNPKVKAAFQLADSAASIEDAFDIIADSLPGARLNANIGLQKEGKYKGNNDLQSSEPLEGSPTQAAPAAPAAATVTEPVAAPAAAEAQPAAVPF